MTRHVSGLTAEHCAVGLVAAASHLNVDPLSVFDGRKAPRATAVRQAVASAVIGSVGKMPGLTLNIARVFHVQANRLAPCEISRAGISIGLQLQIITGMAAAGFDPAALSLGTETRVRALVVAKPRPARLAVTDLTGRSARCAERLLKSFNAGEMTLNVVRDQLQQRMVEEGFSAAQCPAFRDLHDAAKALPKPKAEPKVEAPAAKPLPGRKGVVVIDELRQADDLAERVEAMRAESARRAKRLNVEPEPTPKRIPDIIYGDTQAKPLDLGAGDLALVAACVAQGGFPRAVEIKPGVTVWADHADQIWKFRP